MFKFNILFLILLSKYFLDTAQQARMTEEPRRNLRARKNPKYLNSDEQDPDKVSFSQLKSHHDYNAAHYQKNQDAKSLVKFINKVNKNYQAYRSQVGPQSMDLQKSEAISKEKKSEKETETGRKTTYGHKQAKNQAAKKGKQMYNFKGQHGPKDSESIKNTEEYINKLKEMGSIGKVSDFNKGLYTDQLKKLQSLYPEMKNLNYQSLTQSINPNLFSGPMPSVEKSRKEQQNKVMFNDEKLFKRASYHVAIAYHIHLQKLKKKGGVIGNEIDPTYHAKKLKQGKQ